MVNILKPGPLTSDDKVAIGRFQKKHLLFEDRKMGKPVRVAHQMWNYMHDLVNELGERADDLARENDALMNGVEPARGAAFLPGLAVGLITAFVVWAIVAG